jgi:lactate dehydrogenase-like 2-hydroxyacid dehydrogenase
MIERKMFNEITYIFIIQGNVMKVLAYCTRSDEVERFNKLSQKYKHEITMIPESFSSETAYLAKDYDGIVIFVNCKANREALEIISSFGVKYIASRGVGYDNIDLAACKELGIKASNVPAYSPNSVSELTVGLAITLTRKINAGVKRVEMQNFELDELIGIEIRNLIIGVIGTGKIGFNVIKAFSGFGCSIIANDIYENKEVMQYAKYKPIDEVYAEADIITLHCPLSDKNYHMVNDEAIGKMKNGVIIINVARGGLIDTEALIRGLKSGKIRAAALDTYENEVSIFHNNHTNNVLQDDLLVRLLQYPNVVITPHYAFYTDEAVENMIETALSNLKDFELSGSAKNEII